MAESNDFPIRTAGFWRRLLAFSIDAAVAATATAVLGLLSGVLAPERFPARSGNVFDYLVDVWNQHNGLLLGPFVLLAVLFVLQDFLLTAVWGTTPGRRAVGVRLFGPTGAPPGPGRALLRATLRLVSIGVFGAGCLWTAVQRERRAWHDLLAGTWAGRRV